MPLGESEIERLGLATKAPAPEFRTFKVVARFAQGDKTYADKSNIIVRTGSYPDGKNPVDNGALD
jgi:hypothetical protein